MQFFHPQHGSPVCDQDIAEVFCQEHREDLIADLSEQADRLEDLQNQIRQSIRRETSLLATSRPLGGKLMLAEGERRHNDALRAAKRLESDDL